LINAAVCVLVVAIGAGDLCAFFGATVFVSLLLLLQMLTWTVFRRIVTNQSIWACFLLIPCILITGIVIYNALPSTNARRTLEDGRLSVMPLSARNVKSSHWSGLFTGESYLSFQADKADIEAFLATSPSLQGVKPKVYSKDYQRMPFPTTNKGFDFNSAKFDYFVKQSNLVPDWWNEEITGQGRTYEIPGQAGGNNFGLVIYDEERCIVYIRVTWS
jgi:hypothetical protein